MTKRIAVLSEEIANQIAAGEVVERPASIVKELVENALDADACDIRVELTRGGCESIRITDNGSGIEREDVALVFERHATSKISRMEDLYSTGSFGFRGEAMASIASIAKVELLTRRSSDLAGTKAIVQSGTIAEIVPAGAPAGTQVMITDIFANVPARRKFLKTETTEQSACLDAVTRLALAHPEVRFVVTADGREIFAAPVAKDAAQRVAMIMGNDFAGHCLALSGHKDPVRVKGFISTPAFTRSNSKGIYLFVNSRFIRDNSMTHALLAAYRQVIEPRRYPAAVLFLELPRDDVDVNVHPAKLEVRFKNSREIYDMISKTVAEHLAYATASSTAFAYRLAPRETTSVSSGFWKAKDAYSVSSGPRDVFPRQRLDPTTTVELFEHAVVSSDTPMSLENVYGKEEIAFAGRTYLGQFADTYLVFGGGDGMVLVDQHAAHERILLERLKASSLTKTVSQPLLVPEVVGATPAQIGLLEAALPWLADLGMEMEVFGRDAVLVKAMPACLPYIPACDIVSDLADQLDDGDLSGSLAARKDKILASLACRAAIKARSVLSPEDVAVLCRDLETTPFNATCPHGRPISVKFSLSEIERMFKRK